MMNFKNSKPSLLNMSTFAGYDSSPVIYLDYAATTPTDPDVLYEMQNYFSPMYGNPSSLHTSGRRSLSVVTSARENIARILGASPNEIIFTGGGTESDNLAILGVARANKKYGNHIIISAIEHKAVFEAARVLENEGFAVSIAPVDGCGVLDTDACMSLVRKETILISVMYANNEIGTVEPIQELAHKIKDMRGRSHTPIFHSDACQAVCYLDIDIPRIGVDLLTLNGSKIYGPKGIGVLYKRNDIAIEPIIVGGGQENALRAGTEAVPLIVGMCLALEKAEQMCESETKRLEILREYFIQGLKSNVPTVRINGHSTNHLPNIVHITVPNIEGESMVLMLDAVGVEVATGSACSAQDLKPSHVLSAIGQDENIIHGSIRFSMGRHTTKEHIDYVLSVFPPIVERLLGASAITTSYYERKTETM
jgi:cysteine desulfurase